MFFCSISQSPLTFRPSVEDDYLGSHLRHFVLASLEKREIPIFKIRNTRMWSEEAGETLVLTDKNNKLDEWQRGDALEHWKSGFISFHTSSHTVDRDPSNEEGTTRCRLGDILRTWWR